MKRVYQIWWVALLVKVLLATILPFSNDEAYYWVWGHHPQLSYFDHPPVVGWLFTLGTYLEMWGNAARVPGVLLGHLTLLIWLKILEPYLDVERTKFWLIFVVLSPFMGLGSLIITPDVPLLFFWSLSILFLLRAIREKKASYYLALGASLGLGFCAKYMIVLFVPTSLIWLIGSRHWRSVRWQYVPLTVVAGLVFCLPVIIWNAQNNWASFAFQLNHGLNSHKWQWSWPLEYAAGQLLILFPVTVWWATRKRKFAETSFLAYFGWIPLAFFFYTSFKAHVEANWPIMAHPALLSLAVVNADRLRGLGRTAALWAVLVFLICTQLTLQWIPIPAKYLKTSEVNRFDAFIPVVQQKWNDGTPIFLGSYQMAAAVSYKLRKQVYKLDGLNRRDFYDFTPQAHPTGDRFYLGCENDQDLPAWVNESGFKVASTQKITDEFKLLEVVRSAKGHHP